MTLPKTEPGTAEPPRSRPWSTRPARLWIRDRSRHPLLSQDPAPGRIHSTPRPHRPQPNPHPSRVSGNPARTCLP